MSGLCAKNCKKTKKLYNVVAVTKYYCIIKQQYYFLILCKIFVEILQYFFSTVPHLLRFVYLGEVIED